MAKISQNTSPNSIVSMLEGLFDLAVDGVTGVTGAENLTDECIRQAGNDAEAAIDNLIWWQVAQSSVLGFGLNVGGLITLPVTIPADLAATALMQLRMVASIAHLRGHDIRSNTVRTFAIGCLIGDGFAQIVKGAGIALGNKLAGQVIGQVSGQVLIRINKAVGFRLLTKAGSTGIINLSKFLPLVGGVVAGLFDGATTAAVGRVAKLMFTAMPADGGGTAPGASPDPVTSGGAEAPAATGLVELRASASRGDRSRPLV